MELFETHFWLPEEWRDVGGYEGYYQISSLGNLRSVDRVVSMRNRWGPIRRVFKGRTIKTSMSKVGYEQVLLYKSGSQKNFLIHRLVALAWHGLCPEGKQCAHLDGTRTNNTPDNLMWATPKENTAQSLAHGTRPCQKGEHNPASKLTESDIIEIRRRRDDGEKLVEIAKDFPVSKSAIGLVAKRERWGWVNG